jgi:hypothetical protein
MGVIVVFDPENSAPLALMDGTYITAAHGRGLGARDEAPGA